MEQFFTSLSKRQTMLLLTAATFGGQESIGIFDHLPDDEAEVLKQRATEIAKIPRERRIPLLVQEIKRLVTARRGQLWSADPERLAQVLKGERPVLIEVILRALPEGTAAQVRQHLPPNLTPVKLVREVKPAVLNLVRWKLEEALTRAAPKRAGFKFSDVLLLKSREVLTVCDRLGARALANAISGLPEAERESYLGGLRPDQRQAATKAMGSARALTEDDARHILSQYHGEKDPAGSLTSAGAQRLARASLAQSPEFAARLVERHPGALGQLLLKWVREERPRMSGRGDGGRTDVIAELERLEQKGIIDKPVRLAPPPVKPPLAPPKSAAPSPRSAHGNELPGGKIVPPRPKLPPGVRAPPRLERPVLNPPPARTSTPYRDPIAERQARRAGVPVPRSDDQRPARDPIAEREARRAGALSSRPPTSGPRRPLSSTNRARPPPSEPPPPKPRRPPDEQPPTGERTSLQRAPRPTRPPPGRGPKGSSG